MSWEKAKIKDVCEGIYDGPHATPPVSNDGAIFLGISNITQDGHLDISNPKYISEDDLPRWTKRVIPQGGDIVFSYEATLNLYAVIPDGFHGCLGRRMALIRPDETKVNGRFLYYYFFSEKWRRSVSENTVIGATVDRIPLIRFPDFLISFPSLEEQKAMAGILSAYDDLIENNQKQIKLLEEAAQRLYKEWFVDLRFPGHENTKIVDGVPEGWEMDEVGAYISKVARKKQVMTTELLETGAIPVVDQGRNFVAGYTNDRDTIIDFGIPVIVFGDHTRILKYIQFPFAKGADGTQLIVSNSKRIPQSLLYYSLINVDLSNYHYARHFKYLKAERILVPTFEVANQFDSVVSKLLKQVQLLRDKCRISAEARDRLLPKLMNGEIEVLPMLENKR